MKKIEDEEKMEMKREVGLISGISFVAGIMIGENLNYII